jgi:hypothetical protein
MIYKRYAFCNDARNSSGKGDERREIKKTGLLWVHLTGTKQIFQGSGTRISFNLCGKNGPNIFCQNYSINFTVLNSCPELGESFKLYKLPKINNYIHKK